MSFHYPDIQTTTYNNQRWYDTPAGWMPSITTILGATQSEEKRLSLQSWRDGVGHEEADSITNEAAAHGTLVHLLIERYLKGEQIDAPADGVAPNIKALKAFTSLKMHLRGVDEIYGQEAALYSKEVEVAGRCDLICVFNGKPSIVDFKTSRRIKGDSDIHDYKVQLCFYGLAHNEMFGTSIEDGVVLMASDEGFPQIFRFKLWDTLPELRARAARFWAEAVNTVA